MTDSSSQWESVKLPSRFIPYEVEELKLRPLNIGEVKKVQSILEGSSDTSLVTVVEGAIDGIPAKEFTRPDFWYILAWLRVNTFKATPVTLNWKCSSCGASNTKKYDLTDSQVVEAPEDMVTVMSVKLPNGDTVRLDQARVGDELSAYKYVENTQVDSNKKITSEDTYLVELAISLDEPLKSLPEKIEYLNTLSAEDLLYIEARQENYGYGMKSTSTGTCKECESEDQIRYRFRVQDLIPYDQIVRDYGNAVPDNEGVEDVPE